jgi:uncharacterized protein (TIGR03118 family)
MSPSPDVGTGVRVSGDSRLKPKDMTMIKISMRRLPALVAAVLAASVVAPAIAAEPGNSYSRTDLVSDEPGEAANLDANLINGWGLAASASGPWWVDAADSGKTVIYNAAGVPQPLVVDNPGSPTGIVFNGGADFPVSDGVNTAPARFLFANEDGTISGWSPMLVPNTQARVVVDNSGAEASYRGLALAMPVGGARLYAANFHMARVDVFDGTYTPVSAPGAFVDRRLPRGYAPFGIQNVNGMILVAYAKQDAAGEDEVAGDGLGYVDAFDTDGMLVARVASRGALNAPWGIALAPAGFGRFSGMLLVGNFGDGRINAYSMGPWQPKGHLKGVDGHAIAIDGLWGIAFGNGGAAGPSNTLYFAAGPDDEEHGLFGQLQAMP